MEGARVMDAQAKSSLSVDWRWIVAAYCYLVLFHLLPTSLLGGLTIFPRFPGGGGGLGLQPSDLASVWLLGGIAVVSFIVGLRSKGFTIVEPAVAGMLYAITTTLGFHEIASTHVRYRPVLAAVFWLLIVVILSVASAWMGEVVQQRRLKRVELSQVSSEEKK
jgi:hypothetical protein